MAKLYLAQWRNSEAEALLEKATPVLERAGEPDDATPVAAWADLADAYRLDGRYLRAEPFYGRLLARMLERPQTLNGAMRTGLQGYVQMLRENETQD
jgi:hypothetical protein